MRYDLKVEPDAENDATEAAIWYSKQKAELGSEFLDAVESGLEKIQTDPLLYAVKYKQTRVAYINRFPFGIHFNIEKKRINILAILHTGRNPQIWSKRIR